MKTPDKQSALHNDLTVDREMSLPDLEVSVKGQDIQLQRFYSLLNHSINCVEFKSVTDAKFEPSEAPVLRLMPHTDQIFHKCLSIIMINTLGSDKLKNSSYLVPKNVGTDQAKVATSSFFSKLSQVLVFNSQCHTRCS